MRHLTASQKIARLEQRIARLEKQASGYKIARTPNFFKKYVSPSVTNIEVLEEAVNVSGSGYVYLVRGQSRGKDNFFIFHSYGSGRPDLLLHTKNFRDAIFAFDDAATRETIH